MSDVVDRLATLEEAGITHEARLLILVDTFCRGKDAEGVRGLTKLAKLDFLLRYPTYLERALLVRRRSTRAVKLKEHERLSVESRMVRYRFGPWDHRYPEMLRRLQARGLVTLHREGRTLVVKTSPAGTELSARLLEAGAHGDLAERASALRTHLDLTATNLMKFIYETFPEVVSLRSNEVIP